MRLTSLRSLPHPPQDYLHAAADNTAHASRTVAQCLRSARRAWAQRQAAQQAAGSGDPHRPSSAVLLADFLAALHDAPAEQRPRRIVFQQASDWLLERAATGEADAAEHKATLSYLAAVLRSDEAAAALLQRPGAAPKLLQLAAASAPLQQLLGAAVAGAPAPRAVPAADVAEVMRQLAAARQARRQQGRGGAAAQQQVLLALQLLQAWARASAANACLLGEAGAGHELADLAAMSATGSGVDGLQSLIAQVGRALVQGGAPLRMPCPAAGGATAASRNTPPTRACARLAGSPLATCDCS